MPPTAAADGWRGGSALRRQRASAPRRPLDAASGFGACGTLRLEATLPLPLKLPESPGAAPGTASQHVFGEGGGTIGRANTNGWVHPHNKVSGKHAVISFRNG